MGMMERPSYVSPGEPDRNAILSLIKTTEENLAALERRKENTPDQAMLRSLEAQQRNIQIELQKLRDSIN